MKVYVRLCIVFVFCLSLWQCANDKGNITPTTSISVNTDTNKICFTNDVLPIISGTCGIAGCHTESDRAGRIALTNYNEIIGNIIINNADGSVLYNITDPNNSTIMPPVPYAPLTALQRIILKKWIQNGASQTLNCSP